MQRRASEFIAVAQLIVRGTQEELGLMLIKYSGDLSLSSFQQRKSSWYPIQCISHFHSSQWVDYKLSKTFPNASLPGKKATSLHITSHWSLGTHTDICICISVVPLDSGNGLFKILNWLDIYPKFPYSNKLQIHRTKSKNLWSTLSSLIICEN